MILQWAITHLERDKYHIENRRLGSFASYDNRPVVGDQVLGKWNKASAVWNIRPVNAPGAYT